MDSGCRNYGAKWSIFNWVFTVFTSLLAFVFIPARIWSWISQHGLEGLEGPAGGHVYFLGLLPAILLCTMLFAPIGYAITATAVRIRRPGFNLVVPISDIRAIRRISRKDLGIAVRIGVLWYFGTYGALITSRMGLMAVYVTNRASLVLIERQDGRKVLISPSEPDDFVDRVRGAMPTSASG